MKGEKTISGPYQTYQIRVSVSTLAELQSMQPPGVNGAPTFFRDQRLPWHWFEQLPAGITSSADATTGATTGKSGFWVSLAALLTAVSLGSFLTVARASASRMLDLPLATLYTVRDGARTYVRSVLSGWHWEANFPAATPTDNITTCRPTAWIATGLDGAFVRDLQGDETARRQAAWFINSTAPDNEGTGTALDPLQTDVELARRWGPGSCPISAATVIRYAQAPSTVMDLDMTIVNGGSLAMYGTPTETLLGTVLTAVTAQNRATQTPWDVSGPGLGAHVGKLVEITNSAVPARVGAYAPILKTLGPNQVVTGPFVVPDPGGFPGSTNVTPAAGDTVKLVEPMTIRLGRLRIQNATRDVESAGPPLANLFLTDGIRFTGNAENFGAGELDFGLTYGQLFRTIIDDANVFVANNTYHTGINMIGGYITGDNLPTFHGKGFIMSYACTLDSFAIAVPSGGYMYMVGDCYLQNAGWSTDMDSVIFSLGVAYFDCPGAIYLFVGAHYHQGLAVADWGTNNPGYAVQVKSGAAYTYQAKPRINDGLGAGRETIIGGTDKLYAAIPFVEPANNAMMVALA